MKRTVQRLFLAAGLAAAAPAFAEPAVFTFDGGEEGWTGVGAANGMDNFAAAGGALTWDYVTPTGPFDPILDSPGDLSVDTATEHWLRMDVEVNTVGAAGPQLFQLFYAASNGAYAEGTSRTFSVTPNAGVQTIILDLALDQPGRDPLAGTIVDFRIDPGSNQAELEGGTGSVSLIALTSDADLDGLNDDLEIQIFGDIATSNGSSDTDGDGINDSTEISLGLDPLVDEGATVPVGGVLAALTGLGALGLFYSRRRSRA